MPTPIPPESPSVADILEPYVRLLDNWIQFLFPNLQRIAAEGLAETILVGATIGFVLYAINYCKELYFEYRKIDDKAISFSVNYIENNTFKLRPVAEEISIEDLFPQQRRRKAFTKALGSTTREHPVAILTTKSESSLMGTLHNHISKEFGDNFFAAAAGRKLQIEDFIVMITYEQYEDVPLQKVRVIFTHKELFNNLPDYDNTYLRYEKPHQRKRLLTLWKINSIFHEMPQERHPNYLIELPMDCPEEAVIQLRSCRLKKTPKVIGKPQLCMAA